ncbi:MAG: sigma D regulator [Methylococcales bacterium]
MSTQKQFGTEERRHQTHKMVRELLQERQQVWSLYCSVASLKPFSAEQAIKPMLRKFCQLLVDYISLGHFGIYQRITNGLERRDKVLQKAGDIYPRIAETTDSAIRFNDKYEKLSGDTLRTSLSHDLSLLGEQLATRIELEDQLIETLVT